MLSQIENQKIDWLLMKLINKRREIYVEFGLDCGACRG